MAERSGLRKQITLSRWASITIAVLWFALGFGLALMLTGHGRADIIAGAVVLGASLYVGTK